MLRLQSWSSHHKLWDQAYHRHHNFFKLKPVNTAVESLWIGQKTKQARKAPWEIRNLIHVFTSNSPGGWKQNLSERFYNCLWFLDKDLTCHANHMYIWDHLALPLQNINFWECKRCLLKASVSFTVLLCEWMWKYVSFSCLYSPASSEDISMTWVCLLLRLTKCKNW